MFRLKNAVGYQFMISIKHKTIIDDNDDNDDNDDSIVSNTIVIIDFLRTWHGKKTGRLLYN